MTFDLVIWLLVGLDHIYVKFVSQGHKSKFKVTCGGKSQEKITFRDNGLVITMDSGGDAGILSRCRQFVRIVPQTIYFRFLPPRVLCAKMIGATSSKGFYS